MSLYIIVAMVSFCVGGMFTLLYQVRSRQALQQFLARWTKPTTNKTYKKPYKSTWRTNN